MSEWDGVGQGQQGKVRALKVNLNIGLPAGRSPNDGFNSEYYDEYQFSLLKSNNLHCELNTKKYAIHNNYAE